MMESSVRQRPKGSSSSKEMKRNISTAPTKSKKKLPNDFYLPWYLIFLYLALMTAMLSISLYCYTRLPEPVVQGEPNQFHAWRARAHMEDLVALGVRHVGNDANEIHAKNLLISKVKQIQDSASSNIEIEISVQHPSGSFHLNFLGGLNHIYQNVTNIVVKLSRKGTNPRHAFLINAHYDSALGTVAASDDAVSCGTMLEVMRCLASEPHPLDAEHALIFLFNGAEETFLQASHGFIMQHPWAKSIRAFLNLEAAGAGGREIVFQTGPNHPWLARLYSKVAPYPHATIVAQEVFQSGIIPSDTDFRIFRDFGNIPGIDTAYFINGYVYHTEYDVPSAIPDGSIQRAGENVLALLREVANSPSLSNPDADDLHGNVIFFDIFGIITVVYPEKVSMVMNFVLAFLVALLMIKDINWNSSPKSDNPTPGLFLLSFGIMFLSWLAAILSSIAVAGVLTLLGRSMFWFSQPLLIIPVYILLSILAMGEVHTQLIKRTEGKYSLSCLEKSSFLAIQFFFTILLLTFTVLGICSAFLFFLIITPQLIFRTFLLDFLIAREIEKAKHPRMYGFSLVLCSALATGFPLMLCFQFSVGIMQLFVPLMGRSGALLPPDLAIGGLTATFVASCTPYMVCVVIYSSSRALKRWIGLVLLVVFMIFMVLSSLGYFKPYSMENPEFPRPKRFFLMHTDRTFYDLDGSPRQEDSRVFIYTYDYLGIEPIAEVSPKFRDAKLCECKGLYCTEPLYVPVRHLMNGWYLPTTRLDIEEAPNIKLISSVKTSETSRNFTFQAKFPRRTTMVLGMNEGILLKGWSLESYIPPANFCPGSYQDRGCYFIFLARGFGNGEFEFWIETKGDLSIQESFRIAATGHFLDPPQSQTTELNNLMKDLPKWVTTVAWSASYNEWIF